VLGLIENHHMQRLFAQHGDVAGQQRIAGQQQVVLGKFAKVLLATGAGQGQHPQLRCETPGLVLPVGYQAGRHHHQRRSVEPAGLFLDQDVGDALQRLAEAHVIAKDAAGAQLAQGLHPGQPLQLVGAQRGVERVRCRACLGARAVQSPGEPTQPLAPSPVWPELLQPGQPRAVGLAQPQRSAIHRLTQVQLAKGRQDRLDSRER
jgi:hypothetical protein